MRYAVDKWTNKEIEASEAAHGTSYRCPVCYAPVTLRAGIFRDAYFAHKAGMGTKECDLYHLGGQSASTHVLQDDYNASWEFSLQIQISNEEFPRAWGLELELPYREGMSGEIEIDVGGRTQKVFLSSSHRKAARITAVPQVAPYTVKSANLFGRSPQPTLVRLAHGLKESGATVFGEACVARKRPTPRAQFLECGVTYVFIWRALLPPQIPDELCVEQLHQNGEWDGGIIEIPTFISHHCKNWLEQFTGLALNPSKPQLIPVWPPVARRISTGLLEAPSHSTLIFCVRGTGGIEFKNSTAFIRSGENIAAIKASGEDVQFFKLENEGEPNLEFSLRDKAELRAEIEYISAKSGFPQAHMAVEFYGKNTETGKVTSIQAHDEKAADWLMRARAGEISITTLVLPLYARGTLYRGKFGIWTRVAKITPATSDSVTSGRAYSTRLAQSIAEAIAQRKVDIKIDFAGFGNLVLLAEVNAVTNKASTRLPNKIKQRLCAYIAQLPFTRTQRVPVLLLTDEQLVAALLASEPTIETTAHYRNLVTQLKKINILKSGAI